ncbi:Wzz/FepE/Etk N-terminal domain-containing protein [Bacillus sp. Cr_A10]|uniref:YveK family protein n=1 Tax=Bacillus sp. Cr_A10 TaxID=3033993 RepID=UPI0023D9A918|nr:Wzz/FepE/Etk N-terminal domain-containing protein [Bacillus sp. Cr_A10]MDF2065066.1 Wzz/FepE/Etk N-terminal domain-containing protein [Bacillus sp. Cr_A10]
MTDQISLHDFFIVIKKRILIVICIFILIVTTTVLLSIFLLTPKFEASTQILINQKEFEEERLNTQDIQTNLQLINTYNVIIKSPVILTKVIEELALKTSTDLLTEKISVTSEQNSQVVNIIVEDKELQKAVEIANKTAEVFQEEIKILMNVDNVIILSPAKNKKDMKPVSPNLPINIAISSLIGLIVGIGIVFLLEYIDTTVKTEEDIRELIGVPILGLVSPISQKTSNSLNRRRRKR